MGEVRTNIQKLIKEHGSKKKARTAAEKWYKAALKNFRNKEVSNKANLRFVPGKIYVFRYDDPVTEGLLWWDRNPVVLALDPVNGNDCGINLNLLTVEIREQMLDDIYSKLAGQIKTETTRNTSDAVHQGAIALKYSSAKRYLDKYGFGFAVRQYIPSRKKKQAAVSYENWHQIALCDFAELEGVSKAQLKKFFLDYNKNK